MSSQTRQYIMFDPVDGLLADISSDDILSSLESSRIQHAVSGVSIEFRQPETGNKYQSVVLTYSIDHNAVETDDDLGFNELLDVVCECVLEVVGDKHFVEYKSEGWH